MEKEHIDISTIEGAFTLELKNTEDGNGCFYDVYRHDEDGIVYMGELDPYCADCDFDEIDTDSEDFDEEGFMNAIEDILIDAVINGELYPRKLLQQTKETKQAKNNKNEIEIATEAGDFTLVPKTKDDETSFYDVYMQDEGGLTYMGELYGDYDEDVFIDAMEDIIDAAYESGELYPHETQEPNSAFVYESVWENGKQFEGGVNVRLFKSMKDARDVQKADVNEAKEAFLSEYDCISESRCANRIEISASDYADCWTGQIYIKRIE